MPAQYNYPHKYNPPSHPILSETPIKIKMLNQHRSSTLHRPGPEQPRPSPISQVYDQIMRNFDKEALRIRFKFSNPSFDDAMLVRPRKVLPKLEPDTERKGRLKFYSNKLVVNEAVYINERKELMPEFSEETQIKKLFIPHAKETSILSERNKRIIELYKRAERDAELSPTRIKFAQKIQNPQKQKSPQLQSQKSESPSHGLKKTQNLRSSQKKMLNILKEAKQRRKKTQLPNMNLRPQRSKSNIVINSYSVESTENPQKNTLEFKKMPERINQRQQKQKQKQQGEMNNKKRIKTMRKLKYEPRKDPFLLRKKFNWKNQPLPLSSIQKQQFQQLIRHYLNLPDPIPIPSGFYKAYIGPGNNNALIKKLLKDRGYWQIVESLDEEPNFVWTQIRSTKFVSLLAESGGKEYRGIGKKGVGGEGDGELAGFIRSKRNQYINTCEKLFQPRHFQALMSEVKQRFIQGNNIHFFLRLKQVYIDYIQQYTLKQTPNPKQQFLKSADIRLHNHIQNSGAIGDKKQLLSMMTLYCKLFHQDLNTYIPKTVHLETSEQHPKVFDLIPNGPWVLKPGQATNRGQGITIHTNKQSLISQLTKKKKHRCGVKFTNIVQEYIEPLLYYGRKFDIRMWVLWSGRRLWWYREGYLRTSSREFTLKNLNKFIHLTNDAIQSQSEDFGKYEPANKLSFNQFEKYLEKEQNYHGFYTQILEQMKNLAIKAFRIGNLVFDNKNRQHGFQLFGLDFLIDNKYKPWLIECNTNPCLQINCSLLARLVPNMLQNVMNLTVDSYFPPPLKKKSRQNASWNHESFKFQLLYNGNWDLEMQEKLLVEPVKIEYVEPEPEVQEIEKEAVVVTSAHGSIDFKQKQIQKQKQK